MYNICTWPLKRLSVEINSNGYFVGVIDQIIIHPKSFSSLDKIKSRRISTPPPLALFSFFIAE